MKRLLCGNPYGEYRTKNTENSNRTTSEKKKEKTTKTKSTERRQTRYSKLDRQAGNRIPSFLVVQKEMLSISETRYSLEEKDYLVGI